MLSVCDNEANKRFRLRRLMKMGSWRLSMFIHEDEIETTLSNSVYEVLPYLKPRVPA